MTAVVSKIRPVVASVPYVRELTVEGRAGPVAGRRVLGLREAARAAAVRPAPLAVILPHETMSSEGGKDHASQQHAMQCRRVTFG